MIHVANPHLRKMYAIVGILNAVVVDSAREAIPHRFDLCRNSRGCPIGIAIVGNHATQMLKCFVFVLHTAFQPVFAIKIHYNATLVEAVVAVGEIRFYHETEIFFLSFHLPNRCIIVLEMVIGALPKVGAGFGDHLNSVVVYGIVFRQASPAEML